MSTEYNKITPVQNRLDQEKTFYSLVREFTAKNPKTEYVPCPFCGTKEASSLFNLEGYNYQECNECKSLFNNPRVTPDELINYHRFVDQGSKLHSIPASQKENRIKLIMEPRWRLLKEKLGALRVKFPVNQIMEVGPGIGYFTEVLQADKCSKKYLSVEMGEEYIPFLKSLPNMSVFHMSMEDCNAQTQGGNDLIFINSVIEHPPVLMPFFGKLYELLNPGGFVVLVDMHAQGFDVSVLKDKTPNITPLNILQVGSREGINKLCRRNGFNLVDSFSMGKYDADIVYETARSLPPEHVLSGLGKVLSSETLRKELQEVLTRNCLSGYMGYIIQRPLA